LLSVQGVSAECTGSDCSVYMECLLGVQGVCAKCTGSDC